MLWFTGVTEERISGSDLVLWGEEKMLNMFRVIIATSIIAMTMTGGYALAQRVLVLDELTILNFGSLAVIDETTAASYRILPDGGVVETNVMSLADMGDRGEFSVTGSGDRYVLVTFPPSISLECLPGADYTCVPGADALTVTNFATNFADDRVYLPPAGGPPGGAPPGGGQGPAVTENFFVGADLQIPAFAPDGVYEGTYTVTANYE